MRISGLLPNPSPTARYRRLRRMIFARGPLTRGMGERVCYLAVCPNCDLQVSIADETCPECGAELDTEA